MTTQIAGDAATGFVQKTVTTDNVNYALEKTKEQMTKENAQKAYNWTAQNGAAAYKGTKEFAGKVDHQLDEMGVDKMEVAKKTGAALWDATKMVGGALWTVTKAGVAAA